jgi:hypothetical protein
VPDLILSDEREGDAAARTDAFLAQTVPPKLDEVAIFSANTIFKTFLPKLGQFSVGDERRIGFDRRVIFYAVAGDLIGMCSARVNLKGMLRAWPGSTEEKLIGDVKEAVNQFLGVLSQNFARIGVQFKIGLPTVYNLESIPEVQTLVTFPSVHFRDPENLVQISLGYSDLENRPMFDFSTITPETDAGEIELL